MSYCQIHRRTLADDWRGVGEPLNETGQFGDGLIVRGKHYVLLSTPSKAAYYHRTLAEELYMAPSVMLTTGDQDWGKKFNTTVSFEVFYQNLVYFVLYFKIVNTFLKK